MSRKVGFCVGMNGTGKSRTAKIIRTRWNRTITLDPLDEYDGIVFYNIESLYEYFSQYTDNDGLISIPPDLSFHLSCRFFDDIDIESLFRLSWTIGNHLLVVEEANVYLDPRQKLESFQHIISRGRHKNISIMAVSQRVPELNIAFRAQATSLITFKQQMPYDLDNLEQWGFDPQSVMNLTPFDARYKVPVEHQHYLVIGESLDKISEES